MRDNATEQTTRPASNDTKPIQNRKRTRTQTVRNHEFRFLARTKNDLTSIRRKLSPLFRIQRSGFNRNVKKSGFGNAESHLRFLLMFRTVRKPAFWGRQDRSIFLSTLFPHIDFMNSKVRKISSLHKFRFV